MKKDDVLTLVVVLVLLSGAVCIGTLLGEDSKTKEFQKELVTRGFAEYNSTNGVWQWKIPTP